MNRAGYSLSSCPSQQRRPLSGFRASASPARRPATRGPWPWARQRARSLLRLAPVPPWRAMLMHALLGPGACVRRACLHCGVRGVRCVRRGTRLCVRPTISCRGEGAARSSGPAPPSHPRLPLSRPVSSLCCHGAGRRGRSLPPVLAGPTGREHHTPSWFCDYPARSHPLCDRVAASGWCLPPRIATATSFVCREAMRRRPGSEAPSGCCWPPRAR